MAAELYKDGEKVAEYIAPDITKAVESFFVPGGYIAFLADYPSLPGERPTDLTAATWIQVDGQRLSSDENMLRLSTNVSQGPGSLKTGRFGGSTWTLKKI